MATVAGGGCGGTAAQPNQSKQPTVLSFAIASADYSRALDRIVIVSPAARPPSTPMAPEIHLLDGHTLYDEVIPLPGVSPYQAPTRISVTPDGRHAVVGINDAPPSPPSTPAGEILYVDLAARRVVATYPTPSAVLGVVANDTTAFAFWQSTGPTVNAVDLATGGISSDTVVTSVVYQSLRMAMSPDGKTLYLDCVGPPPTQESNGNDVTLSTFTVSSAQLTPAATASLPSAGCASGLYLSRNGSRVYSSQVYSADLSKTLTHDPPLGLGIADPSNGQPVASISIGASSLLLDLLDPSTFAKESETALPSLAVDGGIVQAGGENVGLPNVFYDAAGTTRFVILYWFSQAVQQEPAYGIVSM